MDIAVCYGFEVCKAVCEVCEVCEDCEDSEISEVVRSAKTNADITLIWYRH